MLYVFAGFPRNGLHAGGLRLLVETEGIGLLEEAPIVQYTRENAGEFGYRMSDQCERDGIGWHWFPENATFGNGVTVHKTTAEYRDDRVLHYHDDQTVTWEKVVEERPEYEARWVPGTCPQESHVVHLTWLVFRHVLPAFAYERLRAVIEDGAAPVSPEIYENRDEPGRYKSETRPLVFGKERRHAIPSL